MSLPLEGIRVIDFSWMLAGPYATRTLADFGAEVIKVQSALINTGMERNDTYAFAVTNRNKLGITLNMSSPQAREIALKLVAISDVVIQNFSPRVLENWTFTYDEIKKINPTIIMADLSGFGSSGPWKDYAALADTVEALSGITHLSSQDSSSPDIIAYPYADIVSGIFACIGILAALENRRVNGQGKHIEISELEAICTMLAPTLIDLTLNNSPALSRTSLGTIDTSFDICCSCKGNDSRVVISIFTETQWQSLCRAIGNPNWTREEKFSTLAQCRKRPATVTGYIQRWTQSKKATAVISLLRKSRIPCSKVNDARDLASDLQLRHRNFFVTVSDPQRGDITMDSTPMRLSRTPAEIKKRAPLLGEDNDYVLHTLLGMDRKTIDRLKEEKVIY